MESHSSVGVQGPHANSHLMSLKNAKGQSTVEYIMLLAVVVSLASGVLRSEYMVNLLGQDGVLGKSYKLRMENSYRFATKVNEKVDVDYSSINHPSYYGGGDSTHFFTGLEPYER